VKVGDLICGENGSSQGAVGIIVAKKQPRGEQKTERIVVFLQKSGKHGKFQAVGQLVETRASYNIWEVISEGR
jgi:hypothetical protein